MQEKVENTGGSTIRQWSQLFLIHHPLSAEG